MSQPTSRPLTVVHFGGGVQSTALLCLISKGQYRRPDAFIFADTQWEPPSVYENVKRCRERCDSLGIPFYQVTAGSLRQNYLKGQSKAHRDDTNKNIRYASLPLFTLGPDGSSGMVRRQCTDIYKIRPINLKIRELLGIPKPKRIPREAVESWMGISTDEASRMRDSMERWKRHVYPLIDLGISRVDCFKLLAEAGWPKPDRSACVGCPFRSSHEWRRIKANPSTWSDATEFDRAIRHKPGMRSQQFLHASRQPLQDVDLSTLEDHGQINLFNNECTGHCGV